MGMGIGRHLHGSSVEGGKAGRAGHSFSGLLSGLYFVLLLIWLFFFVFLLLRLRGLALLWKLYGMGGRHLLLGVLWWERGFFTLREMRS